MCGNADFLNLDVLVFTGLTLLGWLLVNLSFRLGTNHEENFSDLYASLANFIQSVSLLIFNFSTFSIFSAFS